jgi:F0F1-type ATP synthase membrane subunit a
MGRSRWEQRGTSLWDRPSLNEIRSATIETEVTFSLSVCVFVRMYVAGASVGRVVSYVEG